MKNFIYIYSNIIELDAAYSLEENNEDLCLGLEEDPYELHYGSCEKDNSSVIFNIPEDNSEAGSESYPLEMDDDNGSMEFDDSAQYEAIYGPTSGGGNNDGYLPSVITQLQKQLLKGYTPPPLLLLSPHTSTPYPRQKYCLWNTTWHGQSLMAL